MLVRLAARFPKRDISSERSGHFLTHQSPRSISSHNERGSDGSRREYIILSCFVRRSVALPRSHPSRDVCLLPFFESQSYFTTIILSHRPRWLVTCALALHEHSLSSILAHTHVLKVRRSVFNIPHAVSISALVSRPPHTFTMPKRSKEPRPEQPPAPVDGDTTNNTDDDSKLPPLTPQEFKSYNSMAERMEFFVTPSLPSPTTSRTTCFSIS